MIDGAHRLSALIAWINDDYGAGAITRGKCRTVEDWQQRGHDATKELVEKRIHSYANLKKYNKNPAAVPDERTLLRANNAASNFLYVQSVVGDAQNAEKSYYAINQSATPIDETEFQMIFYRRKPNALAARALIRAGSGHKYWSKLPADHVQRIDDISSDIYANLFRPILEYPIKTLDLPAAGHAYTTEGVKLIFDLVNYFNAVPSAYTRRPQIADPKKTTKKVTKKNKGQSEETRDDLPDDLTGAATLEYLITVRKASIRVFGPDESSLGLHPGVYCYGATGRFHSQAFLGAIIFVSNLDNRKAFFEFTEHRATFEEFLIGHRYFVNQITGKYGAGVKSAPWVAQYYESVFEGIKSGFDTDNVISFVKLKPEFSFLHETTEDDRLHGKTFFQRDKKRSVFARSFGKRKCMPNL